MTDTLFNASLIILGLCFLLLILFFGIFIRNNVKKPNSGNDHYNSMRRSETKHELVMHRH